MDRTQAIQLVKDTLTQPFEKGRFHRLIKELLNRFNEEKSAPMLVPDAFTPHVKSCWRLGTYKSPEGELADILIVNTTESYKLDRTRTGLRDFVAHKLKRDDSYKEAGLVAFVSPDAKTWRFSYVRMDYESKRNPKTGKIVAEERLTPARRYSFLVGEGEHSHTAQKQLVPLLINAELDPSLLDIEQAFSVEPVTKEFFNEYAHLFEITETTLANLVNKDRILRTEFESKHVNTVDFSKKLMGQIVFLYFLQKKGWLGVAKGQNWGTGPRDFLRRLAKGEYGKYSNFFNDILEPLFYDTLATDRGHEAWCSSYNCRIPFLNGGLFEPLANYDWRKTDIILPNDWFTNSIPVEEGITGTGILDIFDRYNFTVNEAEPLEKEVAIDPEMLGKVFENLLDGTERKSKGSFYTPREIVHYMCQESLINYLDTTVNTEEISVEPDKLEQTKPIGELEPKQTTTKTKILREVVLRADLETFIYSGDQASHYEAARVEGTSYQRKLNKTIETHARLLDEKLAEILVCDPAIGSGAFPVGMMQEIVRARSALTPYFNDVHERTAYHFKRHAIQNCLYGVDIDPGAVEIAKLRLWLSLVVDEDDVKQIKPLPNLDYKIVTGNSLLGVEKNLFNAELFKRLEELKPLYFDATDRKKKEKFKQEIDNLIHELTKGKEAFDFEIYFSEVFHRKAGFDVVIGNPPYGIGFSSEDKTLFKRIFSNVHIRTPDSFNYFISKSMQLLGQRAVLAFIVPSTLLFQNEFEKTRRLILHKTLLVAVNFGDGIFSSATVPSCVFILVNEQKEGYKFNYCDLRDCSGEIAAWRTRLTSCNSENTLDTPGAVFGVLKDAYAILKKITAKSFVLDQLVFEVAAGIGTGGDKVFRVSKEFSKEQGFESSLLHPVLVGGEIDKWVVRNTKHFVIYPNKNIEIQKYKNIFTYLKPFQQQLSQKRETRNGTLPWWCLHWPRYPELFLGRKIVMRQTSDSIRASIDDDGYFVLNSILVLKLKPEAPISYKATLAILNSTLNKFVYRSLTQEVGRTFAEVKPKNVRKLLIPKLSKKEAQFLEEIVDRIFAMKQSDVGADVCELEQELDDLVYAIYGLTNKEIEIVKKSGA